jgi:uncharacterized membrane protein
MEDVLKQIASRTATLVELIGAVLIFYGALEAVVSLLFKKRNMTSKRFTRRRAIFIQFGAWMLLGLEFQLAADIVQSAISPTWTAIGQLACIAGIRTVLNYFLEKDVEEFSKEGGDKEVERSGVTQEVSSPRQPEAASRAAAAR